MSFVDLSPSGAVTIRPLTIADCDDCVVVENAAFANPDHRASPEKFAYRLTTCPELSLGIFVHAADADGLVPGSPHSPTSPTAPMGSMTGISRHSAAAATTGGSNGILVGHIIATRCTTPVVSDASMGVPSGWRSALLVPVADDEDGDDADAMTDTSTAAPPSSAAPTASPIGHQPDGTTVAVHSLGIVPSVQGRGLGTKLMHAYLERMGQLSQAPAFMVGSAGLTRIDRVALICQDYLVHYYEKLGFVNQGPSAAQFGGGGWFDMTHDIKRST